MTKKDIILEICKETPHISQQFIEEVVDLFFTELSMCLSKEGSVELRGFGNFVCKKRLAYMGVNPKSQERIYVPSKKIIIFKPSHSLKKALIYHQVEKKKFLSEIYKDWSRFKR
ncbi:HU family DNA-binding protein [Holospora curviuscula]|uniref:Integration host factor subunit beta n=1 Tax=Holospora curviuscula TaxID=1082868 RepID=A0A2S5R874_9PROT|nr:HU family DNA-binding protein [Holospora curviuscula]PPE03539.1 Integration host factor subunit beta [Holospora curviuscula]